MKTYIFGAGSSCEFGYPLGKDIFYIAKEMAYSELELLKREHAQHLLRAFESVQEKFNIVFFDSLPSDPYKWPSFEEIYTFVDRELQNPEGNRICGITECLRNDLKTLLFFSLSACGFKPFIDDCKLSDIYAACIARILEDDQVNIITFNYDVLLPFAFKEINVTPDYGYTCYDLNEEDKILDLGDRAVNVVLPHGAINLADCPSCSRRYFSIDPFTASIKNLRANCPKCNVSLIDDFLIPPSFNKYVENEIDASRIIKYISETREIFIVGYSFPPYDYYTRILFLHALSKNSYNPKINIIDVVDREIAERMYSFIDPEIYSVEYHLNGFKRYFYESNVGA